MVSKEEMFKEAVKSSFLKVKEDFNVMKGEIKEKNNEIKEIKEKISELDKKIEKILSILEEKDKKSPNNSFLSSIGNEGVVNDRQQSMINNHQQQTTTNVSEKSILNPSLLQKVELLTDREFSVFLAVLELQNQMGEVIYSQLANKLNLTETTIRGCVNRLISKGLPLFKERFFNKKTTLTSSPELANLTFFKEMVSLRQKPLQKTLFDIH